MRYSQDKGINSYGNTFIELCKANTLRIVNGGLYDDLSVGKVTYTSSQCASTIYVVLTCESSFSLSHFAVGCFNEYSDHAPHTL